MAESIERFSGGTRLLRVSDVARYLSTSRCTVFRWLRTGRLPQPIRFGRRSIRWRAEDLERFIEASSQDADGGELS